MTDDQADQAGGPSDRDEQAGPEDRLAALEEDIEGVRQRVQDRREDRLDDGDRTFIEEGDADEEQPVDDTIVPPG